MIQKIIEGISKALYEEFGDGYTIYTEETRQNMKEPCFFVLCVSPKHELFLGRRYFDEHKICVHYMPKDTRNYRQECHDVADRLNYCLERIEVDGSLRGKKMSHEISDGVLLFFVHYDIFVYKLTDPVYMETLKVDMKRKDEENV